MEEKATKKQLEFIESIEEFVDNKFNGTTKAEAYKYISDNIDLYNMRACESWYDIN